MGSLIEAGKQAKKTIQNFGAQLGIALEPVGRLLREAARAKDLTIPALTLYVHEDIGVGGFLEDEMGPVESNFGQITGVYVPPSVKAGNKVNVILYMHGDKVRLWNRHGTIRDYWSLPDLPLRQGLNTSGQPFILVAPTLGRAAGSEFGNLGTKIDDHLDHVMTQLYEMGPPQFTPAKVPEIDQLIIAGHSGAYGPINSILSSIKKYQKNIKELWAFDIMYVDLSSQFASLGKPVYVYFVNKKGGTTNYYSRQLAAMKLPNVFVMENVDFDMVKGKEQKRPIDHDHLMQRFWLDRCRRIGVKGGSDPDDQKRMI